MKSVFLLSGFNKPLKLIAKRKRLLLLLGVKLTLLAFFVHTNSASQSPSCNSFLRRIPNSSTTDFNDVATAFLNVNDINVKADLHRNRLAREKLDMCLVPLLVASQRPSPIYVVQVGANVGNEFARGTSESGDDPVVQAVVHPNAKGILIEPVPRNFRLLVRNAAPYSHRFICINAAVLYGSQDTGMPFFMMNEERVLAEFKNAPQWFTSQYVVPS